MGCTNTKQETNFYELLNLREEICKSYILNMYKINIPECPTMIHKQYHCGTDDYSDVNLLQFIGYNTKKKNI